MHITSVISTLEHDASLAMMAARSTPSYADVVIHTERSRKLRAMAHSIREAMEAAHKAPAVRAKRSATAPKVAKAPAVTGFAFWQTHGLAVDNIRAVYGDSWKIRAPSGHTVLASVIPALRTLTTERGTKIKYPRDGRFPAAQYWPGGEIPAGVTVEVDYARVPSRPMIENEYGNWTYDRSPIVEPARDAAWYEAHGYAWNGMDWVFELGLRASQTHAEAIAESAARKARVVVDLAQAKLERAALSYGPQPFQDIEDDIVKMAAD